MTAPRAVPEAPARHAAQRSAYLLVRTHRPETQPVTHAIEIEDLRKTYLLACIRNSSPPRTSRNDSWQHVAEKQILLEAVSTAPITHDLLLQQS